VDGERGNVGGAHDAADRQRRPQLIAALLESISEQRCRQWRVDEARGDEVDANRCELKRERRRERRQRGGGRGDDSEPVADALAAGAPISSSVPPGLILSLALRATSSPSTT
jgi:hypothetical protein